MQIDKFGIDGSLKGFFSAETKLSPLFGERQEQSQEGKITWTYRIYPSACVFRLGRSRKKLSLIGWTNSICGVSKIHWVWFVLLILTHTLSTALFDVSYIR